MRRSLSGPLCGCRNGQAAAAPTSSSNSRRLISAPNSRQPIVQGKISSRNGKPRLKNRSR
jgi:hypothetical protein